MVRQIANTVMRMHRNRAPNADDAEDFDTLLSDVERNNKQLTFPPFFIKMFDAARQIVYCESYTISTKFPNNIIKTAVFNPVTKKKFVSVCVVDGFVKDSITGDLLVKVYRFVTVKNVFMQPYHSKDIGSFFCSDGLCDTREEIKFTEISGKFFPFPLKHARPLDTEDKHQHWIMMRLHHV